MEKQRRTKIIATLGPASSTYEEIRALYQAGADVFRLNMSHGSHENFSERHRIVRAVGNELASHIPILADLQGPKIRIGKFKDGQVDLELNQVFRLDLVQDDGDKHRVCLPHPYVFKALVPGSNILINDGRIRLEVSHVGDGFAECRVATAGTISNRKGVNFPDVVLDISALSQKDRDDLEFVCQAGVEWIALSFVQRPDDIHEVRRLIDGRAKIFTKIEMPVAVERFDAILAVSDGIMIARGDLGIALPIHLVPSIQKKLVRKCRAVGKPVVVSTQMLESMIEYSVPTRTEVSDVATAVYDGADFLMLSAESAAGRFPVESVSTMSSIVQEVDSDSEYSPNEVGQDASVLERRRELATRMYSESPVSVRRSDNRLDAINKPGLGWGEVFEFTQWIAGQRVQLSLILAEARASQCAPALLQRLESYSSGLSCDEPIAFVIDAPIAMIRGSLEDGFLLEGLEEGLRMGITNLVKQHDFIMAQRSLHTAPSPVAVERFPDPAPEASDVLFDLSRKARGVLEGADDGSIAGEQLVNTLRAFEELAIVAKARFSEKPGILKRALVQFGGTIAVIADAVSIHGWWIGPTAVLLRSELNNILEKVIGLFM